MNRRTFLSAAVAAAVTPKDLLATESALPAVHEKAASLALGAGMDGQFVTTMTANTYTGYVYFNNQWNVVDQFQTKAPNYLT